MRVERIASPEDPRLDAYRIVRDPELVRRHARFVAEGRHVVRTLLTDSPLTACSVLCDETTLAWLEAELADRVPDDVPVYVADAGLRALGGWSFHQGCLALGERPAPRAVGDLIAERPRVVVALDEVTNPDNVGAIFRTAAAFGAGAVVLSPGCASPLYRKAARTSMGAALRVPFSHGPDWREGLVALERAGYAMLALTPEEGAQPLDRAAAALPRRQPRCLLLGAEGTGLGAVSRDLADRAVRIPMPGGIDSLNVAAAAAIALYRIAT